MLGLLRVWQLLTIVRNRIQARTAANFRLRIALLVAFSLANIGLGGLLYKRVASQRSWADALFTVYGVLYSLPGVDITNEPTTGGTLVLNTFFLFGLLIFATILSLITEEVNSFLLASRSGRTPLVMSGHILLLNWNEQVPFLLDQLEALQHSTGPGGRGRHKLAGRPVVILADNKDKEEMDNLVVGFMRKHTLEVHTRSGKPYRLEHLERVSAAEAAAVLVLHPDPPISSSSSATDTDAGAEGNCAGGSLQGAAGAAGGGVGSGSGCGSGGRAGGDSDAGAASLTLQTIMALTSQLAGRKASVVVQVPEANNVAASSRGPSQLEMLDGVLAASGCCDVGLLELPVKRMVSSLAVQAALQPWSATIYSQLLQHGQQPDITFHHLPNSLFSHGHLSSAAATTTSPLDASSALPAARRANTASSMSSGYFGGKRPAAAASSGVSAGDFGLSTSFSLRNSSTVFSKRQQLMRSAASYTPLRGNNSSTGINTSYYYRAAPEDSLLFEDVRVRYEGSGSIVLGFYRSSDQELVLNPGKGVWCEAGDVLVALTRCYGPASSVFTNLWKPLLLSGLFPPKNNNSSSAAAHGTSPTAVSQRVIADCTPPPGDSSSSSTSAQSTPAAQAATASSHAVLSAPHPAQQHQQGRQHTVGLAHNKGPPDRSSGTPLEPITEGATTTSTASCPQDTAHEGSHFESPFAAGVRLGGSASASVCAAEVAAAEAAAVECCEDEAMLTEPLLPPASTCAESSASATGTATSSRGCLAPVGESSASSASAAAPAALGFSSTASGFSGASGSGCSNPAEPSGLRSSPSWLFSARKLLQRQDQQLAAQRLLRQAQTAGGGSSSSGGSGTGQHNKTAQPRLAVVAGFTARECAHDLLPHFLDFAPPGSRVVFAVGLFDEPPPEFEWAGTVEEDEEREGGGPPILHQVHYRFVQVSSPTSAEGLYAAGVLEADALLLGPEERAGTNDAQADAQVLGSMVELQHLLLHNERGNSTTHTGSAWPERSASSNSSKQPERKGSWDRNRLSFRHRAVSTGNGSQTTQGDINKTDAAATAAAAAGDGGGGAAAAGSSRGGLSDSGAGSSTDMFLGAGNTQQLTASHMQQHRLQQEGRQEGQRQDDGAAAAQALGQQQQQQMCPLHVVACVSNTASKAVAAAFFGGHHNTTASSSHAGAHGRAASSVVSSCGFTYELIVPGEVESAVLVQVAGEPLYTRVAHQLLATPEGCELYLLPPDSFGCPVGETVRFAELQAAGRLLQQTVIGVVAVGGRLVLAPGREWRWCVQEEDRVAVLALSWEH